MKEYELTYLATSSFTKEEAEDYHEKIKKEAGKICSLLGKEQLPIKKTLVYEINKEGEAYLACFNFNGEEDAVLKVEEKIKKEENIIRYIIVKKRKRVIKTERKRPPKKEEVVEKKEKKETKTKKEVKKTPASKKTKISDIDEKIEEII
jgi:ribosomal protein S6